MQLAQSDLRSLAVFRAVVEHKSFLGAQITLGLSQSAVSFHIKALEDRLGFKLCRRGRSGFELTDRGALVHERSKVLFLALNAFESDIGTLKNRITGTLRLGLVDNTITDHDLPIHRIIARISEKAPEARIELVIDTPDALLSEIANGGLDIALLPETLPYQGLKLAFALQGRGAFTVLREGTPALSSSRCRTFRRAHRILRFCRAALCQYA